MLRQAQVAIQPADQLGVSELDQSFAANISDNWRRVASTHSLQDLILTHTGNSPEYGMKAALSGMLLVVLSAALLLGAGFALVGSKVLPMADHRYLKLIQEDTYYGLLVPLTIPVTIAAVTCSWASMKLFKHNS